jgi:peroxiredoxin
MTRLSDIPAIRTILVCLALLTALAFWALRPGPTASLPAATGKPPEPDVHYVTPRQLAATAALATFSVPAFSATANTNEPFAWPRPGERRPLVLVFIKDGCPCSVEMEPFFHRLARTYADTAYFAGVIDADVPKARRYADANTTPYPILADPEQQIIGSVGAENGVYVALLVVPDAPLAALGATVQNASTIDSLWPGCSAEMFTQMSRRIAAAAGIAERPMDVCGLPSAPVTGCAF